MRKRGAVYVNWAEICQRLLSKVKVCESDEANIYDTHISLTAWNAEGWGVGSTSDCWMVFAELGFRRYDKAHVDHDAAIESE